MNRRIERSRSAARRPRFVPAAGLVLLLAAAVACEESLGPAVTYHKRESVVLKEKGTAVTEEEAERRRAEETARRERLAASRDVQRALRALERAEDAFERAEALAALRELGPAAADALDRIRPLATAEAAAVRAQALLALAAIAGADARADLEAALDDPDEGVRTAVLVGWRKAAIPGVDAAMRALDDGHPRVQQAAVDLLAAAELSDAEAVELRAAAPDLRGAAVVGALALLHDRDPVRHETAALAALALDHQEPQVRVDAARWVRERDLRVPVVLRTMIRILGDDPELRVRREVWAALSGWTAGMATPPYDPAAGRDALRESSQAWANWLESRGGSLDK